MDHSKSNVDFFDEKIISDNLENVEIDIQKTNNYNEKLNDKIMKSNSQPSETTSPADITGNKIVAFDYCNRPINNNYYSFDNLKTENIFLHELNISCIDIIKTFKEKRMLKIVDGKYIMNDKDAINLDKMIGLACIAMNESEKNNKRLRTRNNILENKCINYEQECMKLKSELDIIISNLSLALGRSVNKKEDIMHLINIYAALFSRENENHYILLENYKFKYAIEKQLKNIRMETLNNYDEILNSINKFEDEIIIKDLKISQLKEDMYSIKTENEDKNGLQLMQGKLSEFTNELVDPNFNNVLNESRNNDELFEGKLLITEQINRLEGNSTVVAEDFQLSDLINMFTKSILNKEEHIERINTRLIRNVEDQNKQLLKEIDEHKEWQKHLENENEKLNSEIEDCKRIQKVLMNKDNQYNEIKNNFSKMQCMKDELLNENAQLKILNDTLKHQLMEKEIKCVDSDNIIKTLQVNITEETTKFERAKSMCKSEKEKYQRIEIYAKQIVEEFTTQIHQKNIYINSIQDECSALRDQITSTEDEIKNLKHKTISLEYALNKKNKIIKDMLKIQSKQHKTPTTSSQFNDLMHILNKLEQQMDIILDDLCSSKKKIVNYESILYSMQNAIQRQFEIRNYCKAKSENIIYIKYKKLMENFNEKIEVILTQHQKEIQSLKSKYTLKIKQLNESEVYLRNEIQNLNESLKLKSSQIILVEKISYSQLTEAYNIIQRLTQTSTTQAIELNNMKNKIIDVSNVTPVTHLPNTTNKRDMQIECMIDLLQKLKLENKILKKVCQLRSKK